jgi:hypothetical protein
MTFNLQRIQLERLLQRKIPAPAKDVASNVSFSRCIVLIREVAFAV